MIGRGRIRFSICHILRFATPTHIRSHIIPKIVDAIDAPIEVRVGTAIQMSGGFAPEEHPLHGGERTEGVLIEEVASNGIPKTAKSRVDADIGMGRMVGFGATIVGTTPVSQCIMGGVRNTNIGTATEDPMGLKRGAAKWGVGGIAHEDAVEARRGASFPVKPG